MTDRSKIRITEQLAAPRPFSTIVEAPSDAVLIAPRGELDLATVGEFGRELARLIDTRPDRIVIDLRAVEFMDCTGLHALLAAHAQAQRDGWELTIIPGPAEVQRVFEITGAIDRVPFTGSNGRPATPPGVG